jgi:hypothetical protein
MSTLSSPAPALAPIPPRLSPLTSIELRLRQLEYLVSGRIASLPSLLSSSRSKPKRPDASDSAAGAGADGILRHVMTIQSELEKAIEGRSSLERFMDDCASSPSSSVRAAIMPSELIDIVPLLLSYTYSRRQPPFPLPVSLPWPKLLSLPPKRPSQPFHPPTPLKTLPHPRIRIRHPLRQTRPRTRRDARRQTRRPRRRPAREFVLLSPPFLSNPVRAVSQRRKLIRFWRVVRRRWRAGHYGLKEELTKVVPIHRESLEAVSDLESRVVALLGRYDDYVSPALRSTPADSLKAFGCPETVPESRFCLFLPCFR